jgi:hypothetical protein
MPALKKINQKPACHLTAKNFPREFHNGNKNGLIMGFDTLKRGKKQSFQMLFQ